MRPVLPTLFLLAALAVPGAAPTQTAILSSPEALGRALFFDPDLSLNRTQSCASCHDPDHAFSDPRGAASPGDDGISLGDRNAPTALYAALIPPFGRDTEGHWVGGQFHDGRAATLEDQAAGPPLNPIEMGMPDRAAVVARLRANPEYAAAFPALFGAGVLDDPDTGYAALTRAIAAYERTPELAPFDSRYDRFLRGEIELTAEEELGRVLFFSQQFTNCALCHQLGTRAMDPAETFTNHRYFNIGTPENTDLRALNGVSGLDAGLQQNPAVAGDPSTRGQFRVPTLRNVAVTGPYMHNGVFRELRTVILFYNSYNARNPQRHINPETGAPFDPPPVPETLAMEELTHGPALNDQRIDALVAFLRTLTDARYEPLLDP